MIEHFNIGAVQFGSDLILITDLCGLAVDGNSAVSGRIEQISITVIIKLISNTFDNSSTVGNCSCRANTCSQSVNCNGCTGNGNNTGNRSIEVVISTSVIEGVLGLNCNGITGCNRSSGLGRCNLTADVAIGNRSCSGIHIGNKTADILAGASNIAAVEAVCEHRSACRRSILVSDKAAGLRSTADITCIAARCKHYVALSTIVSISDKTAGM